MCDLTYSIKTPFGNFPSALSILCTSFSPSFQSDLPRSLGSSQLLLPDSISVYDSSSSYDYGSFGYIALPFPRQSEAGCDFLPSNGLSEYLSKYFKISLDRIVSVDILLHSPEGAEAPPLTSRYIIISASFPEWLYARCIAGDLIPSVHWNNYEKFNFGRRSSFVYAALENAFSHDCSLDLISEYSPNDSSLLEVMEVFDRDRHNESSELSKRFGGLVNLDGYILVSPMPLNHLFMSDYVLTPVNPQVTLHNAFKTPNSSIIYSSLLLCEAGRFSDSISLQPISHLPTRTMYQVPLYSADSCRIITKPPSSPQAIRTFFRPAPIPFCPHGLVEVQSNGSLSYEIDSVDSIEDGYGISSPITFNLRHDLFDLKEQNVCRVIVVLKSSGYGSDTFDLIIAPNNNVVSRALEAVERGYNGTPTEGDSILLTPLWKRNNVVERGSTSQSVPSVPSFVHLLPILIYLVLGLVFFIIIVVLLQQIRRCLINSSFRRYFTYFFSNYEYPKDHDALSICSDGNESRAIEEFDGDDVVDNFEGVDFEESHLRHRHMNSTDDRSFHSSAVDDERTVLSLASVDMEIVPPSFGIAQPRNSAVIMHTSTIPNAVVPSSSGVSTSVSTSSSHNRHSDLGEPIVHVVHRHSDVRQGFRSSRRSLYSDSSMSLMMGSGGSGHHAALGRPLADGSSFVPGSSSHGRIHDPKAPRRAASPTPSAHSGLTLASEPGSIFTNTTAPSLASAAWRETSTVLSDEVGIRRTDLNGHAGTGIGQVSALRSIDLARYTSQRMARRVFPSQVALRTPGGVQISANGAVNRGTNNNSSGDNGNFLGFSPHVEGPQTVPVPSVIHSTHSSNSTTISSSPGSSSPTSNHPQQHSSLVASISTLQNDGSSRTNPSHNHSQTHVASNLTDRGGPSQEEAVRAVVRTLSRSAAAVGILGPLRFRRGNRAATGPDTAPGTTISPGDVPFNGPEEEPDSLVSSDSELDGSDGVARRSLLHSHREEVSTSNPSGSAADVLSENHASSGFLPASTLSASFGRNHSIGNPPLDDWASPPTSPDISRWNTEPDDDVLADDPV